MTPVLLRITEFDALDITTQAQSPDVQSAQVEEGVRRGKRDPVVGAYCRGQPIVLKSTLEHGEGQARLGGTKAFAGQ